MKKKFYLYWKGTGGSGEEKIEDTDEKKLIGIIEDLNEYKDASLSIRYGQRGKYTMFASKRDNKWEIILLKLTENLTKQKKLKEKPTIEEVKEESLRFFRSRI